MPLGNRPAQHKPHTLTDNARTAVQELAMINSYSSPMHKLRTVHQLTVELGSLSRTIRDGDRGSITDSNAPSLASRRRQLTKHEAIEKPPF